jgi:hypothetical protein
VSAAHRPYILDLESVNGTKLNGKPVPPARYVELKVRELHPFTPAMVDRRGSGSVVRAPCARQPKDTLQFGMSTREYVLMHEALVD